MHACRVPRFPACRRPLGSYVPADLSADRSEVPASLPRYGVRGLKAHVTGLMLHTPISVARRGSLFDTACASSSGQRASSRDLENSAKIFLDNARIR